MQARVALSPGSLLSSARLSPPPTTHTAAAERTACDLPRWAGTLTALHKQLQRTGLAGWVATRFSQAGNPGEAGGVRQGSPPVTSGSAAWPSSSGAWRGASPNPGRAARPWKVCEHFRGFLRALQADDGVLSVAGLLGAQRRVRECAGRSTRMRAPMLCLEALTAGVCPEVPLPRPFRSDGEATDTPALRALKGTEPSGANRRPYEWRKERGVCKHH